MNQWGSRLFLHLWRAFGLRKYRVCAWCHRLVHLDHTPHGPAVWDPSELHDREVSSGMCTECFAKERVKLEAKREPVAA